MVFPDRFSLTRPLRFALKFFLCCWLAKTFPVFSHGKSTTMQSNNATTFGVGWHFGSMHRRFEVLRQELFMIPRQQRFNSNCQPCMWAWRKCTNRDNDRCCPVSNRIWRFFRQHWKVLSVDAPCVTPRHQCVLRLLFVLCFEVPYMSCFLHFCGFHCILIEMWGSKLCCASCSKTWVNAR